MMQHVFNTFLIATTLMCSGCVVPMDMYWYDSRHNVSEETKTKILPGVTTKEEVLLMLGEPDCMCNYEEHIVEYRWQKGYALIVAPGGVGGISRDYRLAITFDDNDRVSKVDFSSRASER